MSRSSIKYNCSGYANKGRPIDRNNNFRLNISFKPCFVLSMPLRIDADIKAPM